MSTPRIDKEQRVFSRIGFDAEAVLRQNATEWRTRVIDLSFRGVMIEGSPALSFNRSKPAEIVIRLDSETRIEMTVRWVHSENERTGFRCESIDIDSMGHLRRLVELNLGDSSLLERELAQLGQSPQQQQQQ